MKTQPTAILLVAALATSAYAQSIDGSANPSSTTSAPAVSSPMPEPSKIIYAPRLPTVNELTAAAAAQQLTIVRIEQSAAKVTAVYQGTNGTTATIIYQLLSSVGGTVTAPAATSSPPPAVVYQPAPRVVYYDGFCPSHYDPYYWYPPVSVRLGFGFRGGFRRW